MFPKIIVIGTLAFIGGCASMPADSGFNDVQKNLADKTDQQIVWNRTPDEISASQSRIETVLKSPLGPDEAVRIALLNNRRLQATYERLGVAQADVLAASLPGNPTLSGDVKFPEGGGGAHLEFSLVDNFIDLLFIPARKSIAASQLAETKTRSASKVIETISQVQIAFYEAQSAQQMLDLQKQNADAADAAADLAQRLRDAGNNTPLDLSMHQAAAAEAKLEVNAAEVEANDRRETLASLLGLEDAGKIKFEPELEAAPAKSSTPANASQRAIERSFELEMRREQLAALGTQLGLARPMGILSEADLGAAYEREIDGTDEIGPSFSIPIPIFNSGKASVAAARSKLRAAKNEYEAMKVEIASYARAAVSRADHARERAEKFRTSVLPLHQQIVQQTTQQYNAMSINGYELLSARQSQLQVQQEYTRTLRDFWIAQMQLDALLAGGHAKDDRED